MDRAGVFADLRRLAQHLADLDGEAARDALAGIGGTAIPLLSRQALSPAATRAALARNLLCELVASRPELAARAAAQLTASMEGACDRVKTSALLALERLGSPLPATSFRDPREVEEQSARAVAHQLASAADVAAAAALMMERLEAGELLGLLERIAANEPLKAGWLARELSGRLDLDSELRGEVRRVCASHELSEEAALPRGPGAVEVVVLDRPTGGTCVVACSKDGRHLVLEVDATGHLESCEYSSATPAAARARVRASLREGYRLRSRDAGHARSLCTAAIRRAAGRPGGLPAAYYLGRDLLELYEVHLERRSRHESLATAVGRAVDLLAAGEVTQAKELAEACVAAAPEHVDAVAALGLCLLATDEAQTAVALLERAAASEPRWAMHHWNLAAAHHRLGDHDECARALAAFLEASERRGALAIERDHEHRVALARRYVAAHLPPAQKRGVRRSRRRRSERTEAARAVPRDR